MSLLSKVTTLAKIVLNKDFRFCYLADKGKKGSAPADEFLKIKYRLSFGKELNLDAPETYTEKLQWLKLYDHRSEYTTMVDKYAVKQYVADKIGEQYVRKTLDIPKTKGKLDYFLKRRYYDCNREWPYKNVPPRIIAEAYMEDSTYKELRDYKFFTFGGEPKVLYIAQGRGRGEPTVADFFDMDFNHLSFTIDHDMADIPPEKPVCFDEMKRLAAILSEGTPQLRVDFYEVDGRVYFGEMTFFHCSGMEAFHPEEWDKVFGDWVDLPMKTRENEYDVEN